MPQDKKKLKESKKPKTKDYQEKLKIEGTLDDVLGISVPELTVEQKSK